MTSVDQLPRPSPERVDEASYYELPLGVHATIDRLRPQFVARGGASLVYRLADGNVVKINHLLLAETVRVAAEQNISLTDAQARLEQARWHRLERIAGRRANYEAIFREHIVPEQFVFDSFPMPGQVLRRLPKIDPAHAAFVDADEVYDLRTIIRRQPFIDISDPELLPLSTRYAERRHNVDRADYAAITAMLMEASPFRTIRDLDISQLLRVQQSPQLEAFIDRLLVDENLQRTTTGFLVRVRDLMGRHGEPVDFIGVNNVFFRPTDDGKWDYFLSDGLYEESTKPWIGANDAWTMRMFFGTPLGSQAKEDLLPMLNVARVFNALAIIVDCSTLQLRPGMSADPETWEAVLDILQAEHGVRDVTTDWAHAPRTLPTMTLPPAPGRGVAYSKDRRAVVRPRKI